MDPHAHKQEEKVGGIPTPVSDCYVWAAICYLDSPTDYREFLPDRKRQLQPANNSVVILDDCAHQRWITVLAVGLIGALTSVLLRIIFRLLG